MTFNRFPKEAYVWVWLPGKVEPVPAGRIVKQGEQYLFNYGKSYLNRPDAISIFKDELPLQSGVQYPQKGLRMPGCLRDAAPDAWGRRVILNRLMGSAGKAAETNELDELVYWLESGSDRIGALDFQASPTTYTPRQTKAASLDELMHASELVEKGVPLSAELGQALFHGTTLGGARPKAVIQDNHQSYIAKFSSSTDTHNVVKFEYMAMRLAFEAGLDVAPVQWVNTSGKDVLLVKRFDREYTEHGWTRQAMISTLTLLGLDEMMARYASYEDVAHRIRHEFTDPKSTLHELFARLTFNILCGNTDDHARNHAAFWDGQALKLTPAYDVCPQPRVGQEASQAMLIQGSVRLSQLSLCVSAASIFQLTESEARDIIDEQVVSIRRSWSEVAQEVELSEVDHKTLISRAFFNPFAFDGYGPQPPSPAFR